MYPTYLLEWWHDGQWRTIGFRATNPTDLAALRSHGASLADLGGHYRLVTQSIYADAPNVVFHEFPVTRITTAPAAS